MASTQINPRYDPPEAPWWKKFLSVLGGMAAVGGAVTGLPGLLAGAAKAGAAGAGAGAAGAGAGAAGAAEAGAAGAGAAAGGAAAGMAGAAPAVPTGLAISAPAKAGGLLGAAKLAPKVIGGVSKLASMAGSGGRYKGEGHVIPNKPGITGPSDITGIVAPAPAAHGQGGWESAASGLGALAGLVGGLGEVKEIIGGYDRNPEVAKMVIKDARDSLFAPEAADAFESREQLNLVDQILKDAEEHYDTLLSGQPSFVYKRWQRGS